MPWRRIGDTRGGIYIYKGFSQLLRDVLEIAGANSPTATTQLRVEDNHVRIINGDYQAGFFLPE